MYLGKSNISGVRNSNRFFSKNIYNFREYLKGSIEKKHIDINKIHKEINSYVESKNNIRSIFFSDETIAKPWIDNDNWHHDLAERVLEVFPNSIVLFTIRKQTDIAKSLYARSYDYYLKGLKEHFTMDQWFDIGGGSVDISFRDRWSILKLVKAFSCVYERHNIKQNIRVIPYEMMRSDMDGYKKYMENMLKLDCQSLDFTKRDNQPKVTSML